MELDLVMQFMIFKITYDLNTYFRKRLIDAYLEFGHPERTTINKCIKRFIF